MKSHRQTFNLKLRGLRRGSAPLELVLSLPIMMLVMAYIIDVGTLAPWKVRGAAVAREALWRTHWPHHGDNNPTPAGWPVPRPGGGYPANAPFQDVQVSSGAGQPDVLTSDPFGQHTAVRGPRVLQGSEMAVDQKMLDFVPGLIQGSSRINLRMPLLPNLPRVTFSLQQQMLDKQMQFGPMGFPNNTYRRALLLYGLANPPGELYTLAEKYEKAVMDVYQKWAVQNPTAASPSSAGVLTLDRDDEFQLYRGSQPNFHPNVRGPGTGRPPCETDREQVRNQYVIGPEGVVGRIVGTEAQEGKGGLPDRMADAFISLYQSEINRLNMMQPPPQGQISALQAKIDQLNQFKQMLN